MGITGIRPTQPEFLPMSGEELAELGWGEPDVLLVSGDAYVDHPSFGPALLGRWLVEHGFRVAILAQPRWEGAGAEEDFMRLPRPRLFAGVTAGAIDSMLAQYTAFRKKRSDDAFSPGGIGGLRPQRATIVYTGLLRRFFSGLPVILGGLEASLRRISHYDFWSDSLRRSVLLDSKADLILCGMAEQSLLMAAQRADALLKGMKNGPPDAFRKILTEVCRDLPGAVSAAGRAQAEAWLSKRPEKAVTLPSHEEMLARPEALLQSALELEKQIHQGRTFMRQDSGDRSLLLAPLFAEDRAKLEENFLDALYSLPFSRLPHPAYNEAIPAWEMIRTSITTHRGCGGGCSFCSLALHQGRRLRSRSRESVLAEAALIAAGPQTLKSGINAGRQRKDKKKKPPKWAGSISDVGGPSANMWRGRCAFEPAQCSRTSCLHPEICKGFEVDQRQAVELLRAVSAVDGVRHVRVASGVRFDMALLDPEALRAYTVEFTGGQLKVAPEHISADVLKLMRKPPQNVFERFLERFYGLCGQAGKEQYVVPYLISAFPGCTPEHMRELKAWLKKKNWNPRQVQCFIPTPGTVATAMYYCEKDPFGRAVPVAKSDRDRLFQHHILLDDKK